MTLKHRWALQGSWDKGLFGAIQVYNWVMHKSAPKAETHHNNNTVSHTH